MKKILGLIFIVSLFSSCSYHIGTIGGGSGSITNNQFTSIEFAYGTSRTVNFLGIGGNKKDALVLEAKRNLYLNHQLKPSQVIGQTTVDFKRTLLFPFVTTKVILSAEIIDFTNGLMDTTQIQRNKDRFIRPTKNSHFEFGDNVNYRNGQKMISATILGFDKDKYIIKYFDFNNNLKVKRVTISDLKSIQQTTPQNINEPESLHTPQNPKGELIKFRYRNEEYTGELIEILGTSYFIKMEKGNGETIGFYIQKKDIIE